MSSPHLSGYMRRADKFIAKLPRELALRILAAIRQIRVGDFNGLNLKKLAGADDQYRVRIGRVRIKFTMNKDGIEIYDVGFRDDTTYKN